MFNEFEKKWKSVTVKEAREKYVDKDFLIWWRPNGSLNRTDPDKDIAWVMEVK